MGKLFVTPFLGKSCGKLWFIYEFIAAVCLYIQCLVVFFVTFSNIDPVELSTYTISNNSN